MKASFNPLFADRTFSTTVPSKVRCSSEMDASAACSSRYPAPLGLRRQPQEYGHPLKGSVYLYPAAFRIVQGLHCCSPDLGPPKYHLRVVSSSSLAPLVGRGRPSTTTHQDRLPYWTERPVGAPRFPSSPGEDPPRKRIVEEDCVLSCKNIYSRCYPRHRRGAGYV